MDKKIVMNDCAAIAQEFPELDSTRIAICRNESDNASTILFVEYHGKRASDIRFIHQEFAERLRAVGVTTKIEFVRAGWLPLQDFSSVDQANVAARYAKMLEAKKVAAIEIGDFSFVPEDAFDSFGYFGNFSKIRGPVEITYPNHIKVGNWVSLGRYGKIVMLPDDVFEADEESYLIQHYPELAGTFDFEPYKTGRPANLYFGDGTSLGNNYFIICTHSVEFGKHVMTASNLFVSDCHHIYEGTDIPPLLLPPTKGLPVKICDHVWIGVNCCILEGVTIGKHAVVAANSVVKSDVPPYSLVAGSPATVKKSFAPE
jgi:acetyltransferase-like isoleucine patch superfamily enzyme